MENEKDCKCISVEKYMKSMCYLKTLYEEKLKEKPNAIQIISLALSCFALGLSIGKILIG